MSAGNYFKLVFRGQTHLHFFTNKDEETVFVTVDALAKGLKEGLSPSDRAISSLLPQVSVCYPTAFTRKVGVPAVLS